MLKVVRVGLVILMCAGASLRGFAAAAGEARETEDWLERARDAASRGLMKRAIEFCDRGLAAEAADQRSLLQLRAGLYERTRQLPAADQDLSRLIEMDPADAGVFFRRGLVRLQLGDFNTAVSDFDQFVALRPSQLPQLWQRGIALFFAERFDDARRQFELHRTVNPHDVENSAWHFASIARVHGLETAREKWMPVEGDRRVPMAEIQQLMKGTGDAEAVQKAVEKASGNPAQPAARLYGELYLAMYYGAMGRRELEARHAAAAARAAPGFGIMGDVAELYSVWVTARLSRR